MEIDYRSFCVLVVDDEPDILETFRLSYGDDFTILTAASGTQALAVMQERPPAVIVADQRMPAMTGTELLERSMAVCPDSVRIILTGYTDNEALVNAINNSRIYRYLTKPWDTNEVRLTLRRAIEAHHLTIENARLLQELQHANARLVEENAYLKDVAVGSHELIGKSAAITRVLELIGKVAALDSTVLIEGETGTGKELVARAIHASSLRATRLFVAVSCAELAGSVLESELFGHRRGAFTGAVEHRKGLIEVADGGTLFLDEIGEADLNLQSKLLRVIEEGEVRPVGANQPSFVDVRIVAATNRRLDAEVKAGRFREDLFYRLRVFPLQLPPLRERRDDIPSLSRHLIKRLSARMNKRVGDLTPEAEALLMRYPFPGNVRELTNEIERAMILAERDAPITEDLFSDELHLAAGESLGDSGLQHRTGEFERQEIALAIERAGGVKTRAAEELGITYRGLLKKMRRLGV